MALKRKSCELALSRTFSRRPACRLYAPVASSHPLNIKASRKFSQGMCCARNHVVCMIFKNGIKHRQRILTFMLSRSLAPSLSLLLRSLCLSDSPPPLPRDSRTDLDRDGTRLNQFSAVHRVYGREKGVITQCLSGQNPRIVVNRLRWRQHTHPALRQIGHLYED